MPSKMKNFEKDDWMGLQGAMGTHWGSPPMIGSCPPVGLFREGEERTVVLSGSMDKWGNVVGSSLGIIGDPDNDDFQELVLGLGALPEHYCLMIANELCEKGLPSLAEARAMGWTII